MNRLMSHSGGSRYGFAAAIMAAFIVICWSAPAIAEEAKPRDANPPGVRLQLRSILLDVEWAWFMAGISGSVDVDVIHFPASYQSSLGLRFGVDRYMSGGPGGATAGSPFTDYNILLRHTASGSLLRLDIYYGWSYYTTSIPQYYPAEGGMKFGVELRLKVVEHFFSLLLKASKPLGLGASVGYDR